MAGADKIHGDNKNGIIGRHSYFDGSSAFIAT